MKLVKIKNLFFISTIMVMVGVLVLSASPQVFALSVIDTINLGDEPVDLAVNPTTNTIYVAMINDNTVSVIDGSTNSVIDTINVGDEPFDIAVNPTTNTIYTANVGDNTVSVIDGSTNSVVDTINVGDEPGDVAINPTTNTIYVNNYGDITVSVIDGSTNSVVDTINVEIYSTEHKVNPTTNTLYTANFLHDTLSVIDGSTNSVVDTINVGRGPVDIAINPTTNTIYAKNLHDDTVSIIDGSTNSVVDTINVLGYNLGGLEVNPTTNTIYATTHDNTLLVIGDIVPPDTFIDNAPLNPTLDDTPTFEFSGTDVGGSGIARFECSIDNNAFTICLSPATLSPLADGIHIFKVRAVDNLGNTDPTPAVYAWVIGFELSGDADENCIITPETHEVLLLPGESIGVSTNVSCVSSFSEITDIVPDTSNCEEIISNDFGAVFIASTDNARSHTYTDTHTITYNGDDTPETVACYIVWSTEGDAAISDIQIIIVTVNNGLTGSVSLTPTPRENPIYLGGGFQIDYAVKNTGPIDIHCEELVDLTFGFNKNISPQDIEPGETVLVWNAGRIFDDTTFQASVECIDENGNAIEDNSTVDASIMDPPVSVSVTCDPVTSVETSILTFTAKIENHHPNGDVTLWGYEAYGRHVGGGAIGSSDHPHHNTNTFFDIGTSDLIDVFTSDFPLSDGTYSGAIKTWGFDDLGDFRLNFPPQDDHCEVVAFTPSLIPDLMEDIENEDLPKNVEKSLLAPLKKVFKILNDGNPDNDQAACDKLTEFLNNLDAKADKIDDDDLVDDWEAYVKSIKDAIGCPLN